MAIVWFKEDEKINSSKTVASYVFDYFVRFKKTLAECKTAFEKDVLRAKEGTYFVPQESLMADLETLWIKFEDNKAKYKNGFAKGKNASEKLFYAFQGNKEGETFIGQSAFANAANTTQRKVSNWFGTLIKENFLVRTKAGVYSSHGKGQAAKYKLGVRGLIAFDELFRAVSKETIKQVQEVKKAVLSGFEQIKQAILFNLLQLPKSDTTQTRLRLALVGGKSLDLWEQEEKQLFDNMAAQLA